MLTGALLIAVIFGAIVLIVLAVTLLRVHPFMALLIVTLFTGLSIGMSPMQVLANVENGFGKIMSSIGLLVVLGSIIGVFLDRSGGALRIADLVLSFIGQKRSVSGMAIIGAVVSIPVFCDSGFIILAGLARSLAKKTGKSEAVLALALAGGLYTTHTLVPPTPGPVAVAGNLGLTAYLGVMMITGLLLTIPGIVAAIFLAQWLGQRIENEPEVNSQNIIPIKLPATWKVFLPILIPILLIAAASLSKLIAPRVDVITFFGHPVIALLIGYLLTMPLANNAPDIILKWTQEGIWQAGPILLLTGAGGAFGSLLRATPLSDLVSSWVQGGSRGGLFFLLIAYAIALLLKTAQGSTTSALVITSSVLAALAPVAGFDTPLKLSFLAAAIGAGGMAVSHVNDSFFWVVSQFSGMDARNTLHSFSLLTALQSVVILFFVCLAYLFLS